MKPPNHKISLLCLALLVMVTLSVAFRAAWAQEASQGTAAKEPAGKKETDKPPGLLRRLARPFGNAPAKKSPPETKALNEKPRSQPSEGNRLPSPSREDYVIGPEDVLAINVWQEPQISRVVPVRPDGKISLPLTGELEAAGLTPLKLQAKIAEALKAFLSNPEVTVIVEKVNSQKFNILGEVLRPGSYDLAKPMNVLDAIAVAGGFREFAKSKEIYVLRRMRNGSYTRIPFNYKEFMKGTESQRNVELEPGDTIVVP